MSNGLIVVGMFGYLYSLFSDGFAILALFNMNPLSFPGLSTMCILVGLARIAAAIHFCVSTCALAASDGAAQLVLDIRDGAASERGHEHRQRR